MSFNLGNVKVMVSGLDIIKKQFSLFVTIQVGDKRVLSMDLHVNKYEGDDLTIKIELGKGIPF